MAQRTTTGSEDVDPQGWARAVVGDRSLPFGARLLAAQMAEHAGPLVSWRRADIAAAMLVSDRTVQRWVGALRRRRWLAVEVPACGRGAVPTYRMTAR